MRVVAWVLTSKTRLQMSGMRDYFLSKQDYLKSQVGNPEGADKPNKSEWAMMAMALLSASELGKSDSPDLTSQSTPTRVSGFARARRP